jgi:hypothetical protein
MKCKVSDRCFASKGIDADIYESAESFEPISFEAMRTNTEKSKYFT